MMIGSSIGNCPSQSQILLVPGMDSIAANGEISLDASFFRVTSSGSMCCLKISSNLITTSDKKVLSLSISMTTMSTGVHTMNLQVSRLEENSWS